MAAISILIKEEQLTAIPWATTEENEIVIISTAIAIATIITAAIASFAPATTNNGFNLFAR
jgi:hypothetical protein